MEIICLYNGLPQPDYYSVPSAEVFDYIKNFKPEKAEILVDARSVEVYDKNKDDITAHENVIRERIAAALAQSKNRPDA